MGRKNKGLSKDKSRYARKKVYTEAGVPIPGLWKGVKKYYVQVSVVKNDKIIQRFQPLKALSLEDAITESQGIKSHWSIKRSEFRIIKFKKMDKWFREFENIIKKTKPLPIRYYHCFFIFNEDAQPSLFNHYIPTSHTTHPFKKIIKLKDDIAFFNSSLKKLNSFFYDVITTKSDKYIPITETIRRIEFWSKALTKLNSKFIQSKNKKSKIGKSRFIGTIGEYFICINTQAISEEEIKTAKQIFETISPLLQKIEEFWNVFLIQLGEELENDSKN